MSDKPQFALIKVNIRQPSGWYLIDKTGVLPKKHRLQKPAEFDKSRFELHPCYMQVGDAPEPLSNSVIERT